MVSIRVSTDSSGTSMRSAPAPAASSSVAIHRSRTHRSRTGISLLAAVATLALFSSLAGADELPLVLSNDSIGLSGAEIEAAQAPPVPTPAPVAPSATPATEAPMVLESPPSVGDTATADPVPSEFVSVEGPVTPIDCGAAAEVAGVASFEHCVEVSIRGGAGFDESSRVCRALFPEQG